MDSQHIPQSLFYAQHGKGGTWVDAQWSAALTDDATGEILATAINPNDHARSSDWAMIGIRLSREFLATIRQLAGFDAPTPAATARAEAAYWQECVQTAVNMLAETRDAVFSPGPVEQYLRQTLMAAPPSIPSIPSTEDTPCYDCRTLTERVANIEQRQEDLQQTSNRLVLFAGSDQEVKDLSKRIDKVDQRETIRDMLKRVSAIEHHLDDDAATFGQIAQRITSLETAATRAIPNRQWEHRVEGTIATLGHRISALEIKANSHATHVAQVPNAVKRINDLDQLLQAVIKDCVAIEERLENLENSKPQPHSAIDALRQIANIQARDPDGLKMTWSEMALACIRIAEKALESA